MKGKNAILILCLTFTSLFFLSADLCSREHVATPLRCVEIRQKCATGDILSLSDNARKDSEGVIKAYEATGTENVIRDGRKPLSIFNEIVGAALAVAVLLLLMCLFRRK